MQTLAKIQRYNLNYTDIEILKARWNINWCGWSWWYKFELKKLFKKKLKKLKWFKLKKFTRLLEDIEILCFEHDIDFTRWWNRLQFIKYNYILCIWIITLLYWSNTKWRFVIFISLFATLNVIGIKYWKRQERLEYNDLFA